MPRTTPSSLSRVQRLFHDSLRSKATEKLHPDLREYLVPHKIFRWSLRHPLVYQVDYDPSANDVYNGMYLARLKALDQAHRTRNWIQFIFLYERPYRTHALRIIEGRLPARKYWEMLGNVHVDAEGGFKNRSEWELFERPKRDKQHLMNKAERLFFAQLPEKLIIYRGYSRPSRRLGLSWTLDYKTARWFAARFGPGGRVLRAQCDKSDVHALFLRRHELEVVVDPAKLKHIRHFKPKPMNSWLQQVWDRCVAEFAVPDGSLHGPDHWTKVAWNTQIIAGDEPGCDLDVAMAFAVVHDSKRLDDGADPDHGDRAAAFCQKLHSQGLLPLSGEQLDKLVYACAHHSDGIISTDPTIGVAWDADRLDLLRVGLYPDRKLLSTDTARNLICQV